MRTGAGTYAGVTALGLRLRPRLDLRRRPGEDRFGDLGVIGRQRPQPITIAKTEELAQPQVGVRGNGTPARHDFADPLSGHADLFGEAVSSRLPGDPRRSSSRPAIRNCRRLRRATGSMFAKRRTRRPSESACVSAHLNVLITTRIVTRGVMKCEIDANTFHSATWVNNASVKAKTTRSAKRDLFAELREGMAALAEARQGKRTLRTHAIEYKPAPKVTPKELIRAREELKLSRALFAIYLRTDVRTLENREQGRARPNAQAALLINLVKRYPDTVRRLASI
jgi:putative transcriptional regulator